MTLLFNVPSRHPKRKGTIYEVIKLNSGTWLCNCPAFSFGGYITCKHINEVKFKLADIITGRAFDKLPFYITKIPEPFNGTNQNTDELLDTNKHSIS